MKNYNVIWTESHSVTITAQSAFDAEQSAVNGDYNEGLHSAELLTSPSAYELTK